MGSVGRGRAALGRLTVVGVLGLGVGATSAIAQHEQTREHNRAQRLLVQRSEQIARGIERELVRYEELAAATAGLLEAAPALSRERFDEFAVSANLAEDYPGASILVYVVPTDEPAEVLARIDAGDPLTGLQFQRAALELGRREPRDRSAPAPPAPRCSCPLVEILLGA